MKRRRRIILLGVGIGVIVAWAFWFRPNPQEIASLDQWNSLTATGRCVVFVDCDWNIDVKKFRRIFKEFAARSERDRFKTATVKVYSDRNGLTSTVDGVLRQHDIGYTMKQFYGAGLVLWFEQGDLVDHAWCVEFPGLDSLEHRTRLRFPT